LATAFFAYSTNLVSKIAAVIGKAEDAKKYADLFERIKKAFNSEFVTETGRIVGNTQCSYLLPLKFVFVKKKNSLCFIRILKEILLLASTNSIFLLGN